MENRVPEASLGIWTSLRPCQAKAGSTSRLNRLGISAACIAVIGNTNNTPDSPMIIRIDISALLKSKTSSPKLVAWHHDPSLSIDSITGNFCHAINQERRTEV
jgi:hypothetical protein